MPEPNIDILKFTLKLISINEGAYLIEYSPLVLPNKSLLCLNTYTLLHVLRNLLKLLNYLIHSNKVFLSR